VTSAAPQTRRAEIAAGLAAVQARVASACRRAGRDVDEVTTVVVTKTFPASDVALLSNLGVHEIGESRDSEAAAKAAELGALNLRWHFVGRLQGNKVRSVASYADVVHSVDRAKLVGGLSRGAVARGAVIDCLVQVSLDGDPSRGGAVTDEVPAVAARIADGEGLRLAGVMAVGPQGVDPAEAFSRLADVAARLRADHPGALMVSAGMSGDLEQAIGAGATHLRVGSAVLGSRPPLE